jgi:hypothetical protein
MRGQTASDSATVSIAAAFDGAIRYPGTESAYFSSLNNAIPSRMCESGEMVDRSL